MVYNTKYIIPFYSRNNTGYVYIKKLDYVGDTYILKLEKDGLLYNVKFDGYFNPIIKQSVYINIRNDADDFFDYKDLTETSEKLFQVIIQITNINDGSITLFDGYLNSDIIEQEYKEYSNISFYASNYISKLDYTSPDRIETIEKTSLINLINDSLKQTGKNDHIRINNTLYPSGITYYNTTSIFNLSGIDNEIFWDNNVERYKSKDIIETILKPIDSYIYWWNGYWYIERYRDLYKTTKLMQQYQSTVNYNYGDGTTAFNFYSNTKDIKNLTFIGTNITRQNIPGFNKFIVNLNEKEYLNLTINDFSDATTTSDIQVNPDRRKWLTKTHTDFQYLYLGDSKYSLSNTVARSFTYSNIDEYYDLSTLEYWNGISTKFSVTNDGIDTVLEIKWTNILSDYYFTRDADPAPQPIDDHIFYNFFSLRIAGTNYYLIKHPETKKWVRFTSSTDQMGCGFTTFNASGVYDEENNIFKLENSLTIPLSEIVGVDAGDMDLILNIGKPIAQRDGDDKYIYIANPNHYEYVGDVIISASSAIQDNQIEYNPDANTLLNKNVSVDIYDIENLNYKNGLFTGSGYLNRTNYWLEYGGDSTSLSLVDWLATSKLQLYYKNRKKISGDIYYDGILKPLEIFYDSYDNNRKYILGSYTYHPTLDKYKTEFIEYDNSEEINIT